MEKHKGGRGKGGYIGVETVLHIKVTKLGKKKYKETKEG